MFNKFIYSHLLTGLLVLSTAFIATSSAAVRIPPIGQPVKILVYDFTFSPSIIKIDTKRRAKDKNKNQPIKDRKVAIGKQVAATVSEDIIKHLRALGLSAERASDLSNKGNAIIVKGQFTDIVEGNRTQRFLVGSYGNRPTVTTNVQILRVINSKVIGVTKLQLSEKTIGKPGVIPMVAVGAAAGRAVQTFVVSTLLTSASEINPKVLKLAKQTAEDVVAQVKPYFQIK